jgi:hypothetical protein
MPNAVRYEITVAERRRRSAARGSFHADNYEVTAMLVRVGSATDVVAGKMRVFDLAARHYRKWAAVFERAHAHAGAA